MRGEVREGGREGGEGGREGGREEGSEGGREGAYTKRNCSSRKSSSLFRHKMAFIQSDMLIISKIVYL